MTELKYARKKNTFFVEKASIFLEGNYSKSQGKDRSPLNSYRLYTCTTKVCTNVLFISFLIIKFDCDYGTRKSCLSFFFVVLLNHHHIESTTIRLGVRRLRGINADNTCCSL